MTVRLCREYNEIGHLLRNFTQSALPELGDGIDDGVRVAGEVLPLCRCPACRRECRCDLFHFFECPHGLSEAARVACCSALEQHASMIGAPRDGDGHGVGAADSSEMLAREIEQELDLDDGELDLDEVLTKPVTDADALDAEFESLLG